MNPTTRTKLIRYLGYPSFFFGALLLMLFLTFPYDLVGEKISAAAQKGGIGLKFGSIGPGFFGLRAKKVAVQLPKSAENPGAPEREPIVLDTVSVRPTLFPPGVKLSASAFGGSVDAQVGALGKRPPLVVRAKDIDLTRANLKPAVGLDMSGKLGMLIDVELDREDNAKTTGRVSLNGEGLLVNGGTVANFDLPKVDLGHLEADVKLDQGKATVQTFKSSGGDIESNLDGEIGLARNLLTSSLRLKLRFKPADDWLRKNSFIQTGLNFAMARDGTGYYTANIERVLGNPMFRPVR